MTSVSSLYETLIERDLDAVPSAVREFRQSHSPDDLFLAVARFAVLAWAPSQHSKHALLCCLAAHDLRDELGARFDDALIECAIYAAQSRPPWSEPPILDPPPVDETESGAIDELRRCVAEGDRLAAERWLSRRFRDDAVAGDYFTVAADDFEDLGHKLIVSTAAWRLAAILGEQGRFAALRIGVWEMTSYRGETYADRGSALEGRMLLDRLLVDVAAEDGSLIAAHAVFLFDAALEAASVAQRAGIESRVFAYLSGGAGGLAGTAPRSGAEAPARRRRSTESDLPIYRFARDYGQCFKSFAVARRLASRFPGIDLGLLTDATRYNLEHAPSFEEWSFA